MDINLYVIYYKYKISIDKNINLDENILLNISENMAVYKTYK